MIKRLSIKSLYSLFALALLCVLAACKHKKHMQKTETPLLALQDTVNSKCKLDYKNARSLSRYVRENEFKFNWVYAKANVEANIDGEENTFDVRVRAKKDSAILITIEKLSIDIAKILITRDSVKMRVDIKRQYFVGDFQYINDILNADLDFDVLQAIMFGNSAEFYDDDESKLKPVVDRANCHYLLSTERKRRLRRIHQGDAELKKAMQTLTLNPDNFKILSNEFIDPAANRKFIVNYNNFTQKDSVYAPYHVDIDIVAQKKASLKIEYVRIEKNTPQKLTLTIPAKYDAIQIQKK